MSLNLLNSTNFFLYSGLNSADTNTAYLDFLLLQFNALIDQELETIFSYTPGSERDYYGDNARSAVIVGVWQPENRVIDIDVTAGGSGYTSVPTVTITGGSPKENATAIAIVESEIVTAIKIDNPGDEYTSVPTVTITGGDGTGATATATLSTLTIERGEDSNSILTTLTKGDDYRLLFIGKGNARRRPGRAAPFGAILLYRFTVGTLGFIRVTGTYGAFEVIPAETMLEAQLYDILKKVVLSAANETETSGKGGVTKSKIDKVEITFGGQGGDSRNAIMTVKDGLEITQGLVRSIRRLYELDKNYFTAVVG